MRRYDDARQVWLRRIQSGQRDALARYGHLSADEIARRAREGKIQCHVAEFLIACRRPDA